MIDAEWHDGKRNGPGLMVFRDGTRYEGNWRNGLPDGEGRLILADGASVKGSWKQGCFNDGTHRMARLVDPAKCP